MNVLWLLSATGVLGGRNRSSREGGPMDNYDITPATSRTFNLPAGSEKVVYFASLFKTFVVKKPALGIDPGDRNMGVALVYPPNYIVTAQVRFADAADAVERIINTVSVVTSILEAMDGVHDLDFKNVCAAVENAAVSKMFGQIELAENRAAAIQALLMKNVFRISVPPPGSIRKVVFGTAKQRAESIWPTLGHDGSSALACALYALLKQTEE